MNTTPEQMARVLQRINFDTFPLPRLMTRIVILGEGRVKLRTHVRTGNLRRSWTHAVETTGERGVIGTNVVYAPFQRNEPGREGIEDAHPEIQRMVGEVVNAWMRGVTGNE